MAATAPLDIDLLDPQVSKLDHGFENRFPAGILSVKDLQAFLFAFNQFNIILPAVDDCNYGIVGIVGECLI